MERTVALLPVRSQLVGRVAHAHVGAQRVGAAVRTVAGFRLALVDVWDRNTQKKKKTKAASHVEGRLTHFVVK